MTRTIELLVREADGRTLLESPGVGYFTCALPLGRILVPGDAAGALQTLDVSRTLLVPPGVRGRVATEIPEPVHAPVAYGQLLYTLEPVDGESADVAAADDGRIDGRIDGVDGVDGVDGSAASGLVLRSSYAGRFWRRPGPGDAAFAEVGDLVEDGRPIGLIEVMKTFTRVTYRSDAELPARARIARFLADDGDEVADGTPLVEVEPA
jgi:acetyl-CoA carboxylase biotin carboxyl carrier protein